MYLCICTEVLTGVYSGRSLNGFTDTNIDDTYV